MIVSEEEGDKDKEFKSREIVLPGELVGNEQLMHGSGTYKVANNIYASIVGIKNIRANYVSVIPLEGRYIPKVGDSLVGKIIDVTPNIWVVDINSPYTAVLYITEVPWRVEFGNTAKFLNINDTILCDVLSVDEAKRVQVTMTKGGKKLVGGQIIEVAPSRVPRVIGKSASMLTLIKNYTKCRIFVAQNGRIWLEGGAENVSLA
ncbi:MAG: exosome complex RNA-binding protein Rrp4, partial [Candidatus Thermoplasmatota archaeon]|nr:exosome complex RNA-binding protein Rrp4 [Candidatus Thermoplasmatota archaeon]